MPLTKEMSQHIIGISEINIAIVSQKLVYSIKIPLLEADDYQIIKSRSNTIDIKTCVVSNSMIKYQKYL